MQTWLLRGEVGVEEGEGGGGEARGLQQSSGAWLAQV